MRAMVCAALALLLLGGCSLQPSGSVSTSSSAQEHPHLAATISNVVEHEEVGYCGNTQTTLRKMNGREVVWETSFMYGDSVALTDLLRWLDYSDDICRCLPEYEVDTEFGGVYGIDLSQGYVRCGGAQVQLTREQLERIREIVLANTPLCGYPIAPEKGA